MMEGFNLSTNFGDFSFWIKQMNRSLQFTINKSFAGQSYFKYKQSILKNKSIAFVMASEPNQQILSTSAPNKQRPKRCNIFQNSTYLKNMSCIITVHTS